MSLLESTCTTVYEDDYVLVESNNVESDTCVITFTHASFDSPGIPFGVPFVKGLGFKGIFFRKKKNDWWEGPTMDAAVIAVEASLPPGTRRITYGSSMGGHGAVAFASLLRCDTVIAFGPQATIDPKIVPWESRYKRDDGRDDFILGNVGERLSPGQNVHLFYDNRDKEDHLHALLLKSAGTACGATIHLHKVTYGGHPCSRVLQDIRLLKRSVESVLFNRPFNFRKEYRQNRTQSRIFFLNLLSDADASTKHPLLAERALGLYRNHHRFDLKLIAVYAAFLEKRKQYEQARLVLQEAISFCDEPSPDLRLALARILTKTQDWNVASRCYLKILRDFASQATATIYAQAGEAQRKAGNFSDAEKTIQEGLTRFGPHPALAVESARVAVNCRDWTKARIRWQFVLDHFAAQMPPEGYRKLGFLLCREDHLEEAETVLKAGRDLYPKNPGMAKDHARISLLCKNRKEASNLTLEGMGSATLS